MLSPCGMIGPTRGMIDPRRRSAASASEAISDSATRSETTTPFMAVETRRPADVFISGPEPRSNGFPHQLRPARIAEIGRVVAVRGQELGVSWHLPAARLVEVDHQGPVSLRQAGHDVVELRGQSPDQRRAVAVPEAWRDREVRQEVDDDDGLRVGGEATEDRLEVLRIDLHRSEEHTSELQSPCNLVCRLL